MSEKASKESQYSFEPLHPPRRGEGCDSETPKNSLPTKRHMVLNINDH